ncbi:MAG: ABC transporter permease [Planctomycetes bacterium]|nr:ABC transporter permease [Planctomycetota bacterium]
MLHAVVHTFRDIRQYKIRSLITLSGALWGVMILVAVYSPIRAFERECARICDGAGGLRQFDVALPRSRPEDVAAARALLPPGVEALPLYPQIWWFGRQHSRAMNLEWDFRRISGVPREFLDYFGFRLSAGRGFCDLDDALENRVCIVGGGVRRGDAKGADLLGRQLTLSNTRFTVVGVLDPIVHTEWDITRDEVAHIAGGFPDACVFLPLATARGMVDRGFALRVRVPEALDLDLTLQRCKSLFPGKEVAASSLLSGYQDLRRLVGKWERGLSVVIGLCLLMSGIGVAVLMLSSIHLRIREIGIRKAVGASNLDIAFQFLVETSVLSTLGGCAGVVLGLLLAHFACGVIGFPTAVDPAIVLLGFASSIALGVVFGTIPAFLAARMSPVEALRSE